MAMEDFYPEAILKLPEADIPFPGVRGKLLASPNGQIVFFEMTAGTTVPLHAHGAQWGVVLEGEMELTIAGQTRTYRQGHTYFIPAGAVHGATFKTRCRLLDFFADADRYRPKSR